MVTSATGTTELVESGEQRDALGRRRYPKRRREELLAAFQRSGLTQQEFARREGIKYTTFCTWAQIEREAGRLPAVPTGRPTLPPTPLVRFVEAQLPAVIPSCAPLEVHLPDGTLVRGGNATELATLIRALRA